MAGVSECFSIGSIVACTTCFKQNIEGEVMAFDPSTKMLILKCPQSSSTTLNDVFVVNLSLCSDVQVKQEATGASETPRSLNLQRLSTRVRNSVEQKKRWVAAISAGVSSEGQNLYMAIAKIINEVTWVDSNIVVYNDVVIKPPYRVENISGTPDSRQFTYVRKMVERLTRELPAPSPSQLPAIPPATTKSPIVMPNQAPLPQRQHSAGNGPMPPNGSHYPPPPSAKHSAMSNIRAN